MRSIPRTSWAMWRIPVDKIQLYLLSGFLGAGKTTLLQQMVGLFPHNRLGVLVNEFGDLGMDGVQFRGDGEIKLA